MYQKRVMICDDSLSVHESLSNFLRKYEIATISVFDGESALDILRDGNVNLIVLDIMLPNMDGMTVCQEIRKNSNIPIIFLSSKSEEEDRIRGLELGGDDYVTKPYSPRELALKIKRILDRLSGDSPDQILKFRELSLNPETMEVRINGSELEVTAKEFQLLFYLVTNSGKVLNREQILKNVWGYDYYGNTRAVDALVKRIRQKLPVDGVSFTIESIYGVGYRLGVDA